MPGRGFESRPRYRRTRCKPLGLRGFLTVARYPRTTPSTKAHPAKAGAAKPRVLALLRYAAPKSRQGNGEQEDSARTLVGPTTSWYRD